MSIIFISKLLSTEKYSKNNLSAKNKKIDRIFVPDNQPQNSVR